MSFHLASCACFLSCHSPSQIESAGHIWGMRGWSCVWQHHFGLETACHNARPLSRFQTPPCCRLLRAIWTFIFQPFLWTFCATAYAHGQIFLSMATFFFLEFEGFSSLGMWKLDTLGVQRGRPWHAGLGRWLVSVRIVVCPLPDGGRDFRADLLNDRTLSRGTAACFQPLPCPCGRTSHGVELAASVALLGSVVAGRAVT